jgi:hypothetical protein
MKIFLFVGIEEEMKNIPDMDKKFEQMEENGGEFDFDDDDDEDIPEIGMTFLSKNEFDFTLI